MQSILEPHAKLCRVQGRGLEAEDAEHVAPFQSSLCLHIPFSWLTPVVKPAQPSYLIFRYENKSDADS